MIENIVFFFIGAALLVVGLLMQNMPGVVMVVTGAFLMILFAVDSFFQWVDR